MENKNDFSAAESGWLPFDPIVLVQDVLKRWLVIAMAAIAVGVGSFILADLRYEPVYQANATLVVTSRGSGTTVYSNLTSTSNVASIFTELLNSSLMRKTILQAVGTDAFDGTITASVIPETNLMNLKVTASDPRMAFLVARAVLEHHEELTYQVIDAISLEVLKSPVVPMAPINSANAMGQMKRMAVLAALCTAAACAWLSFTRDAVRSGKEARKKLDCSYLGEIPHEKKHKTLLSALRRKKSSILITNAATSFRYVETIRKLRRRVEQHMHGGKVLMVTSLLENEGKSTVAANLALSMAQKYDKVLLIDCDLRKPACYALLEQKLTGSGVRDVLSGKAAPEEAVLKYKKTNLDLLLEKKTDRNSGDRLASEQMGQLLAWAREHYDFVVLDLPPMSVVSDTEGTMEYADASLLVVRQNAAVAPALNKVIASLQGGSAKLIGCVLNNVVSTGISDGQGYGGYGYGKYNYYGYGYGKSGKKGR